MKRLLFSVLIITLSLLINFCNTTEPKPEPELVLKLEDVSCTEAWLQLTTNNIQLPATINLLKNNTVSKIYVLSTQDSLLYIDSLLPNQTYKFLVTMQHSSNSSNETIVTTMDTTSHNFTWQTFTFGQHSSSVLYDVAIINENDIWAVGEIYMNDSLGNPDPACYNAVHWDGTKWELKKIKTNACGGVVYPPIQTIFAFSQNDVLFAHIDGSISHFDGVDFTNNCALIIQLNGSAKKIWGISKNDFYVVSNNGFIAHYQNGSWTKIESGTVVDLRDIWGTMEGNEIFISGYSMDLSNSILLELTGNVTEILWENNSVLETPPYGNIIFSLAGYKNNLIIASDLGVFKREFVLHKMHQKLFTVPRRVYKLASTNINDIYTVGIRSNIWHYNGISKKELYVNLSVSSPFYSAAVKGNTIAAVGTTVENVIFHKATIIIGIRN